MLKNKIVMSGGFLLAMSISTSAMSMILDDLSQKNQELMMLKADFEIIKKKQEIKKELEGKDAPKSTAASGTTATTPLPAAAAISAPQAKSPAMTQNAMNRNNVPIELSLFVKSVAGDISNPGVEFNYFGTDMPPVFKGQRIADGWRLGAVNGRTVMIEKLDKKSKVVDTKVLYLGSPSRVAAPQILLPTMPYPGAPLMPPVTGR